MMAKYRIYYALHRYADCSDTPRATSRVVTAVGADEAVEQFRRLEKVGKSYIGTIYEVREEARHD